MVRTFCGCGTSLTRLPEARASTAFHAEVVRSVLRGQTLCFLAQHVGPSRRASATAKNAWCTALPPPPSPTTEKPRPKPSKEPLR